MINTSNFTSENEVRIHNHEADDDDYDDDYDDDRLLKTTSHHQQGQIKQI